MTHDDYLPAWQTLLALLADDAAAGRLTPDRTRRRHAERMARATVELRPAPPARTHAERMQAASGIHLTAGESLTTKAAERRRVLTHRNQMETRTDGIATS
jgi:hypothetical protein